MKKIIGITGGIGSGKSSVSRTIEENGFPVYYSDVKAKNIVNENKELKEKIILLLGTEAYDSAGLYNKKLVADKVFANDELLAKLNSLIHPAVKSDFEKWVNLQVKEFLFKETALLYELGLYKDCYQSILVTAEDSIRIKRVMKRDDKTYREVASIMEKQMPEKEKYKFADYIIYNNSTLDELKQETEKVLMKIVRPGTLL